MGKKAKQTEVEIKQDELNLGVDEATEVLLATYIGKLDKKVKAARERVENACEDHEVITNRIKDSIDTEKFNHVSETLGISSRVQEVRLDVGKTVTDSNVRVVIMLTDLDIDKHYTPEFGKYRKLPMSGEAFEILTVAAKSLELVEKDAEKVFALARNTTDIERQLRAEVVKANLTKMDMGHLLESETITAILDI